MTSLLANRSARACALLLLATTACARESLEETETTAAVAVSVETARVDRIDSTIDVTGVVEPAPGRDWIITAPEAGRVAELPRTEGEPVAVGDLLVRFDIPTLSSDLAARRSEVASAKARVTQTAAEVGRLGPLVEKGIAAQRELDEARRAAAEATASVEQAESALTAATALAERATVRATFPGVVAKRWHNVGDFVEAAASPVLRVIDPAALQVVASVPAADVRRVVPGRTGWAVGPSGEREPLRVLTRPPQVEPSTTMAPVRLAFGGRTGLTAGTAVRVAIVAESHDQAILIPAAALVREDDETFVMVVGSDQKAHRHDVTVGLRSGDVLEVTKGISAGDLVIFRGQDELPDGGTVTIVK